VAAADKAGTAFFADGVDFIEEDDARRIFLGLAEQVADAAGADADEHLDKITAGDAEKRHIRFAGNALGQKGLAAARRADHEDRPPPGQAVPAGQGGVQERGRQGLDQLAQAPGLAADLVRGDLLHLVEQVLAAVARRPERLMGQPCLSVPSNQATLLQAVRVQSIGGVHDHLVIAASQDQPTVGQQTHEARRLAARTGSLG